MAEAQRNSVLRRKAEAGRTSVVAARQITPGKALSSAFVQTLDKRLELVATVSASASSVGTLAEVLEMLPEGGLFAVLEAQDDVQGLMVFDADLLSGVLEQMMMRRVSTRPPTPRRPTRTDAALTADLIDALLRRFEAPFAGQREWRWLGGFGYATYLDDARPLGLMMEDVDYRILTLNAEIGGGVRNCKLMVALPLGGGASAGSSAEKQQSSSDREATDPADAPPWSEALEDRVLPSKASMTAILHRMNLPLATVEGLAVGMELTFSQTVLDETALVGVDGSVVARGRLGQSGGRRAVRLVGTAAIAPPAHGAPSPGSGSGSPPLNLPETEVPKSDPFPSGLPSSGLDLPDVPDLPADLPEVSPPDFPTVPDLPTIDDLPAPPSDGLPSLDDLPDPGDMGLPALDDLPKLE